MIIYKIFIQILYTFVPNKPFGSLLEISSTNCIFLKTFKKSFKTFKKSKYGLQIKELTIRNRRQNKFNFSN